MPGTPHYPRDIGDEVGALKRGQQILRTASQSRVGFDQIKASGLTVYDDNGNEVAKFGYLGDLGGESIWGMWTHRVDGSESMRMFSSASGSNTYSAIFDRSGHVIFSDDGISGQGIATPHIPMGALGVSANAAIIPVFWPRTTSGSMVTLLETYTPASQPKIRAIVYGFSDAATTGEFNVLVNSTSITGGPIAIPAGGFGGPSAGPYALPGWGGAIGFMDEIHIEVQCRRLTGTGSIYVQCLGLYGSQS